MSEEKKVLTVDPSIEAPNGQTNGSVNLVDSAGAAIFGATSTLVGGDVRHYVGAGAPVDYTDGDPAATGEGEAGIGSLYTNTTNGKLYVNKGTKAEPIWGIVTSA